MDRSAVLTSFRRQVDELEKHQGFIDKAKSQEGKFAASIVEKVIKDNTAKVQTLAAAIIPVASDVEHEIGALTAERAAAAASRAAVEFDLQVLELRLVIGEIDQAGFDKSGAAGLESFSKQDAKLSAIDAELGQFNEVATRWTTVGTHAGVLTPPAPAKSKKTGASAR